MNLAEQQEQRKSLREQDELRQIEESFKYAAGEFDIPREDIIFYNVGSCYNRIVVLTEASAKKVSEKVAGQRVNGGMLDGMPLGGITEENSEVDGKSYSIYC